MTMELDSSNQEETREWKATLRVYKTCDGTVFLVFATKGSHRQWEHLKL